MGCERENRMNTSRTQRSEKPDWFKGQRQPQNATHPCKSQSCHNSNEGNWRIHVPALTRRLGQELLEGELPSIFTKRYGPVTYPAVSIAAASNQLMRRCFLRRQDERLLPTSKASMEALSAFSFNLRFLTVLTSGCVTTSNFLAPKISPLYRKSQSASALRQASRYGGLQVTLARHGQLHSPRN